MPTSAAAARADDPANPLTVVVTGSSLANIVTSPLLLTPAFNPTITDYVLRCQSGTNTVHATVFAAGGTISALGSHGSSVDIQDDLIENEALVIEARASRNLGPNQRRPENEEQNGRIQYWIRCLPHDFPQLTVTRPGNPPLGWYLTNNFSVTGVTNYPMVLDNYGTPVWYQQSSRNSAINVTPLPDGTIAWWASGEIQDYNLRTQATSFMSSPDLPTDLHELHPLPNGDVMILSSPQTPNVDLSSIGLSSDATLIDCVIEELNPNGVVVWRWRASDHVSPSESPHTNGGDLYHCNSIDTDPISGNVLLSSRHTDAVYLIDRAAGAIIWKMGGKSPNHDKAQILTIKSDPDGVFHAQHDARFEPNGDVSLFDDQTWDASLAARGVEYHIDTVAGTATLVWAYESPDGANSKATGSFRRLKNGTDNVIGWGVKPNSLMFSEVDSQGRVLINITMPIGENTYRVVKVPITALDRDFLRATAGLPAFVRTTSPTVAFIGSARGPATGGAMVTITGTGLTGATAVSFGPNEAAAFAVNNDSSITAIAPPGSGVVSVTVATRPTPTRPGSILTTIDSDFEGDIGSWRSAGSLASTTSYVQSGTHSLQLSPPIEGTESVASGRYAVPAHALITGSVWVLSPQRSDRVRAFIAFYNSNGALIAVTRGQLVTTANTAWTQVAETTVSPVGTASGVLGFEDASGVATVYFDGASLSGSNQYAYQPPNEETHRVDN